MGITLLFGVFFLVPLVMLVGQGSAKFVKLGFVVDHFLPRVAGGGVLIEKKNGFLRTNLLAISTVNATEHVDFEFLRSLLDVFAILLFFGNRTRSNPNGFRRTNEFAQLTGNAFFTSVGIFDQSRNTSIILRKLWFFLGVLEGNLFLEHIGKGRFQTRNDLRQIGSLGKRQWLAFKNYCFGHDSSGGCGRWLIEPCHEQDIHDQVDESQWQKFRPTDAHDLVVTESGNRPSDPNEEKDQKRGFGKKPTYAEQGSNPGGRPRVGDPWEEMPTAEE